MERITDQAALQTLIDDEIEENHTLEYKSGDSLGKSDERKREITKDVSALANSAGGTIIYGVREFKEEIKKHLPEALDPINRTQFPREWLEQVINPIQPRIEGLVIIPIPIAGGTERVAYVLEVPQSTTAHQALDKRYYRRFNFQTVPMYDHEIRDVMNRSKLPDLDIELGFRTVERGSELHRYILTVQVVNKGVLAVQHYKFQFSFPGFVIVPSRSAVFAQTQSLDGVTRQRDQSGTITVTFRSKNVLFPQDSVDIGSKIDFEYHYNEKVYREFVRLGLGPSTTMKWVLFADNMIPKRGEFPLERLNDF